MPDATLHNEILKMASDVIAAYVVAHHGVQELEILFDHLLQ